nr:hypothetical protein [Tanacetum cinerariifolium]
MYRSAGHRPNGTHMRPLLKSSGPRPHGNSMRPPFRPAGHRPHGPSMNPKRPTMNESTSSKPYEESSSQVPEGNENPNSTASTFNPSAKQMETLTVESSIPTVKTPSLDNILSLTNRFDDILGVPTSSDEITGVEADIRNMETSISASPTPTHRIHKDHPKSQIIGPMDTPIQTRHKSKMVEEQSFMATIHQKTDPALLQFCLYSCFLSQVEPKRVSNALVKLIGTKWVLKNKKDERGIVVRNKARLVAQGHTQEEGINYDEVFAPVARIEAIRLFLAYASFMGFIVYQMDVKSAFLYGTIDEEVYVMQPPGFHDPEYPAKVYKVEKAIEFESLMYEKFQMSDMGELNFFFGLQVL